MPLRSKLSQGSSTPIRRNTLRGERQSYHLWWLLRDMRPLRGETRATGRRERTHGLYEEKERGRLRRKEEQRERAYGR